MPWMRADSLGIFWQDLPKVKEVKEKALVIKMLPPPLKVSILTQPKKIKKYVMEEGKKQVLMDIECFPNYFLILFRRLPDHKLLSFELKAGGALDTEGIMQVLDKYEVITFNGLNYDIMMLQLALIGADTGVLKAASNRIFNEQLRPYQFEKEFDLPYLKINHIDLADVAPGVAVGLKLYGARLNCTHLQDLPYPENTDLTLEQMEEVKTYCGYDLEDTFLLFRELQEQIMLRRAMSNTYLVDLRSKSDAQIAEEIIKSEIQRRTGRVPSRPQIKAGTFLYKAPSFISFGSQQLKDALEIVTTQPFTIVANGRIEMPKELLLLRVGIGESTYQMGMGGLHSTESSIYHVADSRYVIKDLDVTSYYPQIILNCELYPERLGRTFLEVYRKIVQERLEAKMAGNKVKADSLKITVNGSFGKLGSPYSALYSPDLMVQVTVTGQLSLLMLIEALELNGISVVSGNTDGLVVKCPVKLENLMEDIVSKWEEVTGFSMEHTNYAGIYSRDVNNYIAIKYDGSIKTKGCFSPGSISKNPASEICNEALIKYLIDGTSFEDTIHACKDIKKFLNVRNVKGGAYFKKDYLGRVVRWYYAKGSSDTINYRTNDNQVAKTFGAKPLMTLPNEFPSDINYQFYIQETYQLI